MNDKKLIVLLITMAVLCLTALSLVAQKQTGEQSKIRVLFIYGGHGFDEKAMYAMLDSFEDITYDIAEMPQALDLYRPGLEKQYDCIVMYDSYTFPYTKEQTDNFKMLLEEGIALVVLHHSVWGFNGWDEFANIAGGQCFFEDGHVFDGVTYTTSTWDHDQTMQVKVADKDHPITQGTDDFTIIDEAYGKAYIRPDVHVLLTTDHPKSEKVVAWTLKYGKSPVFTTMLGHDAKAYSNPNFSRTVHQAIQWTVNELRKEKSAKPVLSAGTAKVSINPEEFPVLVSGGYVSRQVDSADNVMSDVFARALVLDNGSSRIAIATLDVCILDTGLCHSIRNEAARQTGIPADHIAVTATHTHVGGSVGGVLGTPMDDTYSELVRQRTIEAIVKAASKPVPVKIGWKATDYPEGTHCRVWITRPDTMRTDPFGDQTVRAMMHPGYQNPDYIGPCGPVNSQLSVISLRTLDDKPFAVFANYPMHYFGAGSISSDYFGPFCDILEERLGMDSSGLVLHSQGTSGDLHWMDYTKPHVSPALHDYASKLADVTMALLADIHYHDWVPLDAKQVIPTFERRRPDEFRLAWAREKVRELEGGLPRNIPEVYAYEAIFLDADPKRDVPLQAIRIGDVGMTAIPCEVYAITGLKLAQRSPFEIQITLELANGGEGYIPPPEVYPFGGYNTWPARSAALVTSAETEMVEISLGLLEGLAGQKRKVPVPIQTAYSETVLADNPYAFWRMNNIDGKICPDGSANANQSGTYQSCVAYWLDGPEFAGKDGETVIVPAVHFAGGRVEGKLEGLSNDYSFEAWIWNGLEPDLRPVTGYIFSRDQTTGKSVTGDHLGIGGTYEEGKTKGRLFFYNGDNGKDILVGQTIIPLKQWTHIVTTREGDKVSLYVNGKLDVQGNIARTFAESEPSVIVGNRSDRFAGLEGKMAETAFYNRVLTANEIEKHWKSAK